ncbi:zinc finger protein 862-like [Saccoglossus kowalevskii]|uniref:Uncharacterized protein LOC102807375 n=1 Tax=Saccoglossus kowalevskii TaxID=10224 RepID=A0ABM0MU42_SACKO|nr:PREDICTED: uncharacterized protein LOC102807375 [Saccoglossus kowalevskii]
MILCLADDAYPNSGSGDSTAVELLKFVTTYQFLATLYFMSDVLKQLNLLSKTFQKSDSDCSILYTYITAKTDTFQNMKENAGPRLFNFLSLVPDEPPESGKFYIRVLDKGISFSVVLDEGEEGVAILDSKNYRKFFESSRKHYLDNLISNLKDRFDNLGLLGAFKIFVPNNLPPPSSDEYRTYGNQEIEILCEHYGAEKATDNKVFSPVIEASDLKDEWLDVKGILSSNFRGMSFQTAWQQILCTNILSSYPNTIILAKIALIVPVSTADCERGFSRYNLIKNKLRASLKVSSVSCLMTLSLETPSLREMDRFNFHRAFEIWCAMKNRRIFSSANNTVDITDNNKLL